MNVTVSLFYTVCKFLYVENLFGVSFQDTTVKQMQQYVFHVARAHTKKAKDNQHAMLVLSAGFAGIGE